MGQLGNVPLPPRVRRVVRHAAGWALRHAPPIRGRERAGVLVNRLFWPSADDAIDLAPMRLGYKMFVDLRSYTEYPSYYTGDYCEPAAIRTCLRLLDADSVVLDVGANVGFWSVALAKAVFPAGALFAFEPHERNFLRLRKNLELNGLLRDDSIYQMGLSDRSATLTLSLREDFQSGASTGNAAIVEGDAHGFAVVSIEVRSLDEVFPRLGRTRLDFIKVDIEGHEDAFLRGSSQTLERFRPVIYSEINDGYFANRGLRAALWFSQWAETNGYDIAVLHGKRVSFVRLDDTKDAQLDAFLVPREKVDWFLRRTSDGSRFKRG